MIRKWEWIQHRIGHILKLPSDMVSVVRGEMGPSRLSRPPQSAHFMTREPQIRLGTLVDNKKDQARVRHIARTFREAVRVLADNTPLAEERLLFGVSNHTNQRWITQFATVRTPFIGPPLMNF